MHWTTAELIIDLVSLDLFLYFSKSWLEGQLLQCTVRRRHTGSLQCTYFSSSPAPSEKYFLLFSPLQATNRSGFWKRRFSGTSENVILFDVWSWPVCLVCDELNDRKSSNTLSEWIKPSPWHSHCRASLLGFVLTAEQRQKHKWLKCLHVWTFSPFLWEALIFSHTCWQSGDPLNWVWTNKSNMWSFFELK